MGMHRVPLFLAHYDRLRLTFRLNDTMVTVRTLRYPEDLEAVYWAQDELSESIGGRRASFQEAFDAGRATLLMRKD